MVEEGRVHGAEGPQGIAERLERVPCHVVVVVAGVLVGVVVAVVVAVVVIVVVVVVRGK